MKKMDEITQFNGLRHGQNSTFKNICEIKSDGGDQQEEKNKNKI